MNGLNRTIGIALFAIALSIGAFAAEEKDADAPIQRASAPAANGMELFSWHLKGDDTWHFALLPGPGSDKLKSAEFVTSKENAIEGTAALKKKLAALAMNEKVGWYNMLEKTPAPTGDAIFDFPPKEMIKELEIYCTIMKVRLNIYQAGFKKPTN